MNGNLKLIIILFICSLTITGCDKAGNKVRLGYTGRVAELPAFAALKKNIFRDEGLEIELVQTDFEGFKKGIADGTLDGGIADYKIFKALDDGLPAKISGGIQGGCIKIIVKKDSRIRSIGELKGKTVGVEEIGGGPMIVSSIILSSNNIDEVNDISWKAVPWSVREDALENNSADAMVVLEEASDCSEMRGKEKDIVQDDGNFRTIFSISASSNIIYTRVLRHFYQTFICVSDNLVKNNPKKAAALTRALLNGARWVSDNSDEALTMGLEGRYIHGDFEDLKEEIAYLMWNPGIRIVQDHIKTYLREQKKLHILNPSSNADELFRKSFIKLIPDLTGR
ncbi:MAG: ABC transporter substrate-binding protein [Brevinematales bacterium]|jgi:NitT/TauT family transport system substrate-binding protein